MCSVSVKGKEVIMFQKQMFELLMVMLTSASPEIVEELRAAIQKMKVAARETENPWDDMLAMLLGIIMGRPGEPVSDG